MMLGEDESNKEKGAFGSKSVWARMAVIAAGPIFNFLLAFVLSVLVIGSIGYDKPQIRGIVEGYSADEAGMQAGGRHQKDEWQDDPLLPGSIKLYNLPSRRDRPRCV